MTSQTAIRNLQSAFINNPAFMRSTRSRMRGMRTFILPVIYALVLGVTLYISISVMLNNTPFQNPTSIGRYTFMTLTILQCIILTFVCPTLTAGIVTLEKEKQTYDMLVSTPMHPRVFIWGEIASAVFFAILMIVSSLPLTTLCMVLGGVSPGDVLLTYTNYIILAFLFTSYGILISTIQKKTSAAMGAAVGSIFFLVYPTVGMLVMTIQMGFPSFNFTSTLTPYFAIIQTLTQSHVNYLTLGWLKIPDWLISFFVSLSFSIFILTVATRKFYSSRNRALSPLQFTLVYSFISLFLIGSLWNSTVEIFLWVYSIGTGFLLFLGVLNFIPEHPLTEDYLIVPEDLVDHKIEKSLYQFRLIGSLALASFLIGIGFMGIKGNVGEIFLLVFAFITLGSITLFSIALSQFMHKFVLSRRVILGSVFVTLLFLTTVFPLMANAIILAASDLSQWVFSILLFSPYHALLSIFDPASQLLSQDRIFTNSASYFPFCMKVSFIYLTLAGIFALCALFKTTTPIPTPNLTTDGTKASTSKA